MAGTYIMGGWILKQKHSFSQRGDDQQQKVFNLETKNNLKLI